MPSYKDITDAYAAAHARFNLAIKKVIGFLPLLRKTIEDGLGAPAMNVILFPMNGEPDRDYSGEADVAHFDGKDSWHVGLAIHIGNAQRVKFHIVLDMRNGECFARIGPDGEPYEVKKHYQALAKKLAELAIERLNELAIDPAHKESFWIKTNQC